MKFLKLIGIFLILILVSCDSTRNLPTAEILSANYSILTHSEFERGYQIELEYQLPKTAELTQIILNNFKFKVKESESEDEEIRSINSYFPIQSKMIQNFEAPQADNRDDGILFELDGVEIYKKVKFKLK